MLNVGSNVLCSKKKIQEQLKCVFVNYLLNSIPDVKLKSSLTIKEKFLLTFLAVYRRYLFIKVCDS